MTELGDYIYVGTARNMFSTTAISFGFSDSNNTISLPPSLVSGNDNCAEIWRYKKDNSGPWQRVLKTKPYEKIYGFRAMITHVSNKPAIYAASSGENINLYKSTDGVNWLKNQWTLVGNKGFGDKLNFSTLSTGVFNGHLYAAFTKKLPLALFMPLGFDLIRIDENDNWDLVVGGKPIVPSCPSTGKRCDKSLSGYDSGFNNLFNVYGWQIQEYKNNLIITTYDGSTNIKAILQAYLYDKENYIKQIGCKNYYTLIECYKKILNLICKYNYPEGFDIYVSKDGCKFKPVILNGLYNPNNYGGRTLYKICDNKLYLGTANPFDGLEVWEVLSRQYSTHSNTCFSSKEIKSYLCNLKALNNAILELYPSILKILYNSLDSASL